MDGDSPGLSGAASLRTEALAELARRGGSLRRSAALRRRFEADQAVPRAREQRRITAIAVGIFLAVTILLDLLVTAEVDWPVVILQMAVPSLAAGAIAWWFYRPEVNFWARERAMLAGNCLFCLATVLAVAASPHNSALINQFLVTLPVILSLFLLGLPFRYSVAVVLVTAGALAALIWLRTDVPAPLRAYPLGFLLAASLPALVAVRRLERATWRIYLHDLLRSLQIDELEQENERLSALSQTDPLTGAANRRRLDRALADICGRPPEGAFLLLVDVDHFKRFNDQFGHLAGDACLRSVVEAVAARLGRDDLLARFGGEEFAVLLAPTTELEAQRTTRSILAAVEELHVPTQAGMANVTVSIGVAPYVAEDDPRRLMMRADAALYAAKSGGRNCVRWPPGVTQAVA